MVVIHWDGTDGSCLEARKVGVPGRAGQLTSEQCSKLVSCPIAFWKPQGDVKLRPKADGCFTPDVERSGAPTEAIG